MTAYRKKPVVVDAFRVGSVPYKKLAEWCGGTPLRGESNRILGIVIPTLEGDMRANDGDYIIRGVQGEFYPCKPEIFDATYEPVGDGQ